MNTKDTPTSFDIEDEFDEEIAKVDSHTLPSMPQAQLDDICLKIEKQMDDIGWVGPMAMHYMSRLMRWANIRITKKDLREGMTVKTANSLRNAGNEIEKIRRTFLILGEAQNRAQKRNDATNVNKYSQMRWRLDQISRTAARISNQVDRDD